MALHIMKKEPLDLVLLDLLMPGLDGYKVLEAMMAAAALREIPVLVVTGVDNMESAARCIKHGAEDYVIKPYDPDLLKVKVGSLLERKRIRDVRNDFTVHLEKANRDLVEKINRMDLQLRETAAAAETARRGESRYKLLLEAANEGLIIHGKGMILDSNRRFAALFGADMREIPGMSIVDFVDGESQGPLRDIIKRGAETWALRASGFRKDGKLFPVELRGRNIAHEGRWARAISIREVALDHGNKRAPDAGEDTRTETSSRDTFVSLLSHNLREPLASVVSMLNVLGSMRVDATTRADILERCVKNANSLMTMVERLLDLGRFRRGKVTPHAAAANCWSMAEEAIERFRGLAGQKGIEVNNHIPSGWNIRTDSELMTEALSNLISNAVKYSKPGGAVSVRLVRRDENGPAIAVRDNGAGINPKFRESVFLGDPKFRTPGSAGEKGTGMGLALSSEIMAVLGGSLSFKCPEDGGTIFYLSPSRPAARVLIIAASRKAALNITRMMGAQEAEISMATAPGEAIEILRATEPKVIVTALARTDHPNEADMAEFMKALGGGPVVISLVDGERNGGLLPGVAHIPAHDAALSLPGMVRQILEKQ
jgi:PAS domain S-box-containing protein